MTYSGYVGFFNEWKQIIPLVWDPKSSMQRIDQDKYNVCIHIAYKIREQQQRGLCIVDSCTLTQNEK